ncbi:hypothetical protein WMF27_32640 [Sorangium sp. So ce281]|uniref:hypothetical protein n=1 Tax=unclassified Sorangium TaxID=2621164 RepID=UPI003F62FCE2
MVTVNELLPYKLTHDQVRWSFDTDNERYAQIILDAAIEAGVGHRGAVIGVATACQESRLRNLRGGDRDSLGLFQQRPSQGWGTTEQILDPHYAAGKFFSAMKTICPRNFGPLYLTKTQLWEVAQAVQRSGYPTYYAKHELAAAKLVAELINRGDPAPRRVSLARKAKGSLRLDSWEVVSFTTEYSDHGDMHPADGASFIQGPAHYMATAAAEISGLVKGTTIQSRFVEISGTGAGTVQKYGPIQEHVVTAGATFITQTRAGAVCDDGNRVQWRIVVAGGSVNGILESAEVQAHYWAI